MKEHADNSMNPNNQYGWGLPNGRKLFDVLGINHLNKSKITLYPNPVNDFCQFNIPNTQSAEIAIYTSTGALLKKETIILSWLLPWFCQYQLDYPLHEYHTRA